MPSTFTILPRKGDNSSRGEMRWKPNLHEEHQLGRKLTSSGQTYPPVKVIRMSPSERYFGSIVLTTSPTASVSEDKYSPGSRSKLQDRKTAENGARLQEKRSCSRPVRQRCIKLAECVEVDRKTSFAAKHKIFNKFVVRVVLDVEYEYKLARINARKYFRTKVLSYFRKYESTKVPSKVSMCAT
eukprot:31479-Pelagococcus_subviridis.AAC.12